MKESQSRVFKTILTTIGRKSGKEHSVWLRAVYYENKIYLSRRNSNSDWLKNAQKNSAILIKFNDSFSRGTARLVNDPKLVQKISNLKYSDERAKESRVVLEISLDK